MTKVTPAIAILIAVAFGCGGTSGTLTPEQCAMNPLAVSCGGYSSSIEEKQGALAVTVGPEPKHWGDYQCTSTTPWWVMWGATDTSGTLTGWQTQYDYDQLNFNRGANITMATGTAPLTVAMDGPYHVLYNTTPTTAYLHNAAHLGVSDTALRVVIPAYGTWIYAAHERSDYPQGAQVITIDPIGVADPNNGICDRRLQFVIAL